MHFRSLVGKKIGKNAQHFKKMRRGGTSITIERIHHRDRETYLLLVDLLFHILVAPAYQWLSQLP